jgi:hypothetical protein
VPYSLSDSRSYLFDDINDPTRLQLYSTGALTTGTSDTIRLGPIFLSAGRSSPTRTIEKAFPWLEQLESGGSWRDSLARRNETAGPNRFIGLQVELRKLVGGSRCEAADPTASGPIQLPETSICRSVGECARGTSSYVCGVVVGGLKATVDASFQKITYSADAIDGALKANLFRESRIRRDGGPGAPAEGLFQWSPETCLDGVCVTERISGPRSFASRMMFYYPATNRLVTMTPISHTVYAGLFTATPSPTYGGFE